jgi:hypothetical protein
LAQPSEGVVTVARGTIRDRLSRLEQTMPPECPSCRQSQDPIYMAGIASRLRTAIAPYYDPQWCREEAARLFARADHGKGELAAPSANPGE